MASFFDIFKIWQREDEAEVREQEKDMRVSFAAPDEKDGATEVERDNGGFDGFSGFHQNFYANTEPKIKTTRELINTYRTLSEYHEVDNAIQEIVFDAIVYEDDKDTVSLDLDSTDFSDKIKEKIHDEMNVILNLYKFDRQGTKLFRRWYVDSRIYFHKILHKDPKKGIQELRVLDPRKIEFVREFDKETKNGVDFITNIREFFIYDKSHDNMPETISNTSTGTKKIRLPRSMVVYANSGLTDCSGSNIISYLHKARKPANQLKMLEDALVIYRITRAPERRVFYIDVGNMPNKKATQHVNQIMQGLKNRVVYDSSTGKIKNQYNNLSMTEDYWLMRRDGKAVTQVDTLPGAQNQGSIDDVSWFNKKLYEALHLPLSRIPNESGGVQFGGGAEISRDEIKFAKFIRSLQVEFKEIFTDPLKTNLILKNIITEEEWNKNENEIKFKFNRDSYFEEQIKTEILNQRVVVMESLTPYIGRYFSNDYILKNIMNMSEDEIEEQRKKILEERNDEIFKEPIIDELEEF